MRKPLLKHKQIARLGRMLDMLYKPSELAEEIGVTTDTIYRSYLPAGLPFIREHHDLYIHGPAFVRWAKTVDHERKAKNRLPDHHAYCIKCDKPVEMRDARRVYSNRLRKIAILQSICPFCLCAVNRIIREAA